MRYQVSRGPHILDRAAALSLDLARDLAFDAGPRRRRQHDEPVEFLLRPRVGALALLRGGPAIRRQPQQKLGAGQPLLGFGGEVAAAPPNRLRLRDVERGNVLADAVAVLELGISVTEDVLDGIG